MISEYEALPDCECNFLFELNDFIQSNCPIYLKFSCSCVKNVAKANFKFKLFPAVKTAGNGCFYGSVLWQLKLTSIILILIVPN